MWVIFQRMKILDKILYFVVAGFVWIIINSSCANQGMPTGGPKDTIPPVLVGTHPLYKSLNYKGDEVRLTFDEFIIPDQVSEILVVSPPLEKRPTILTKSKSLLIRFNEELRDSITYSLDFKNSIVDNNERNAYESLRFTFSTGSHLDTLRVAGKVLNSFDLEPVENTLVLLHKNLHDSAVYTLRPDYIARTNKDGLYLFDNIAKGKYNLFSFNDLNNDFIYNEGAEEIAFHDTFMIPSAYFEAETDTLALPSGADSLLIEGHIRFLPEPVYLRHFTEKIYDQYLKSARRDSELQMTVVFNEPVSDTFNIELVDTIVPDWYVFEPNLEYDSLTLWIADTTLASIENIRMELSYFQLDSLDQLFLKKDTVEMEFAKKKEEETKRSRRRGKEEEDEEDEGPPPVPQFNLTTNVGSSVFELNDDIVIKSPHPIQSIDTSAFVVYLTDDTLKKSLPVIFMKDSVEWRTYRILYKWESETGYTLAVDSAACENIYGITSKKLSTPFKTRAEDYYGTINLELTDIEDQIIVQLLENTKNEEVVQEEIINGDGTVVFRFVAPGKYKVKVIYDENGDGKWNSGSFQDKVQPERVAYVNEVIKVRSNWENNLSWNLEPDPTFTKNIRDKELEEQMRKEAEERARKEQEQQFNTGQQQEGIFQPGGSSGIPLR